MTHYQEYTLFLPPNCPTMWDHLKVCIVNHGLAFTRFLHRHVGWYRDHTIVSHHVT